MTNDEICFEIKATDNNSNSLYRNKERYGSYNYKTNNIDILKNIINKRALWVLQDIEQKLYIENTEEYSRICQMIEDERKKLTEIANKFLNDNKIDNENIRKTYIDAFIDNCEKSYELKIKYIDENEYKLLPDLFLVFARATKDKLLEEKIIRKVFKNSDVEVTMYEL